MSQRVAGLNPFTDDRPKGRAMRRSVPIPGADQRPQALTPQAAPVNTYARPPEPPRTNPLLQLAEGLAALSPALARFAAVQEQPDPDEEGRVIKKAAQMTTGELSEAIRTDPEFATKVGRQAASTQWALRAGEDLSTQLKTQLADGTFNPDTMDFDEWWRTNTNPMFEQIDPSAAKVLFQRLEATRGDLLGVVSKYKAEKSIQIRNDNIIGATNSLLGAAIDGNSDPTQISEQFRLLKQTNKTVFGVPYSELDEMQLEALTNRLESMSPTDPKYPKFIRIAKHLLTEDRIGEDGLRIGPITQSTSVGAKASKLLGMVEKAEMEHIKQGQVPAYTELLESAANGDANMPAMIAKFKEQNPEWELSPEKEAALLMSANEARQRIELEEGKKRAERAEESSKLGIELDGMEKFINGDGFYIADMEYTKADGTRGIYKAEDIRKRVATSQQKRIDETIGDWRSIQDEGQRMAKLGEKAALERKLYGDLMVTNDRLKNELTATPGILGTVVRSGGDVPEAAMNSFEQYLVYNDQAPQMVSSLIDTNTRKFFETARIAYQTGHVKSTRDALILAANATANPDKASRRVNYSDATVLKAMKDTLPSDIMEAPNSGMIIDETRQLAEALMNGLDLDPAEAVRKAAETTQKNYIILGADWGDGMTKQNAIVKTGGMTVPPQTKEAMELYLTQFAEKHGPALEKAGIDKGSVTYRHIGGRTWALWDEENKQYLSDLPDSSVTIDALIENLGNTRRQESAAEIRKQIEEYDRRFEPYFFGLIKPTGVLSEGIDEVRNTPAQNKRIFEQNKKKVQAKYDEYWGRIAEEAKRRRMEVPPKKLPWTATNNNPKYEPKAQ